MDIPDIFLNIIHFCDIETIQKCSNVCHLFRDLIMIYVYPKTIESRFFGTCKKMQDLNHLIKIAKIIGEIIDCCHLHQGLFVVFSYLLDNDTNQFFVNAIDIFGTIYCAQRQLNFLRKTDLSVFDMFQSDDFNTLKLKFTTLHKLTRSVYFDLENFSFIGKHQKQLFHPINQNCIRNFVKDSKNLSIVIKGASLWEKLMFQKIVGIDDCYSIINYSGIDSSLMMYFPKVNKDEFGVSRDPLNTNRIIFYAREHHTYHWDLKIFAIEKTETGFIVLRMLNTAEPKFLSWCSWRQQYVTVFVVSDGKGKIKISF